MHSIENDQLKVVISEQGAELQSIWHKMQEKELLWQGDAQFWGRKAPVLFPFIGKLKDNCYTYDGITYPMGQHGFARDRAFELLEKNDTSITFCLKSDAESMKVYPFEFELQISFALSENNLTTRYKVINPSNNNVLYFSIGAHPGFNVGLNKAGELDDVTLHFEKAELLERHLLDSGLVSGQTELMAPSPEQTLALSHGVFETDAIIFKDLKSTKMSLIQKGKLVLSMRFAGFPFMGIWTKVGAPYICLEPWCGLADYKPGQEDIRTKEGILSLEAHKSTEKSFFISVN